MPPEQWRCLRTNKPLERLMREIRRRPWAPFLMASRRSCRSLPGYGMLQQPGGVPNAACRWTAWPKSWPSLGRFGPHGGQEQNNPNPTTFQHAYEERKCEKRWTRSGNKFAHTPGEKLAKAKTPDSWSSCRQRTSDLLPDHCVLGPRHNHVIIVPGAELPVGWRMNRFRVPIPPIDL